jgi:hypothetical protein
MQSIYDMIGDERKKETNSFLIYIFDVLAKNKCSFFEMGFSGGGDDGQMQVDDHDCAGLDLTEPTIFIDPYQVDGDNHFSLEELIEQVCHVILIDLDVDYCNGNGNNGSVYFDVKNREVKTHYLVSQTAVSKISVK